MKGAKSSLVRAVVGFGLATSQCMNLRLDDARSGWKTMPSVFNVGHLVVWTILNLSKLRREAKIFETTRRDSMFGSIKTRDSRVCDSGREVYCVRPTSVTPGRFSSRSICRGGRHKSALSANASASKFETHRLRNDGRRFIMRRKILGSRALWSKP
jgi:hypothetical protein